MSKIVIPDNVWMFLHSASEQMGRFEAERFSQDMHSEIIEAPGVASPIEQIFLIALNVMAAAHYDEINPEPINLKGDDLLGVGIHVHAQYQIDTYRVDFLVRRVWIADGKNVFEEAIVELDGHDFHDKDKRQRSYEKARDRHLIRRGFKVLHFTGSDVVSDPYRVAHEVMDTLECFNAPPGFTKYNPADPFAQGY